MRIVHLKGKKCKTVAPNSTLGATTDVADFPQNFTTTRMSRMTSATAQTTPTAIPAIAAFEKPSLWCLDSLGWNKLSNFGSTNLMFMLSREYYVESATPILTQLYVKALCRLVLF